MAARRRDLPPRGGDGGIRGLLRVRTRLPRRPPQPLAAPVPASRSPCWRCSSSRWRSARRSTGRTFPGGSCWSTSASRARSGPGSWRWRRCSVGRSAGSRPRPAQPARRLERMSDELRSRPSAGARAPGAHRRLPRLERRRAGRVARGRLSREDVGRGAVRDDRAGGLLRLPGDAADGLARRRAHATDRLARERLLPRVSRGARTGRAAAPRRRAEPALAALLEPGRRPGARVRGRDGGDARRAARGRAAHAPGSGHRHRERPRARRAARAPGLALRGTDRDRRCAPRRLPSGVDPVREPVGGRAALRLARARAPAPRSRSASGSATCWRRRSTRPSWRRPSTRTRSASPRPSRRTRRPPSTSRSSNAARR